MNYYAFTPATDTTELRATLKGQPLSDLPTVEIHILELRPAITRYERPSLLARLWVLLLASAVVGHLRESYRAAFWPAVCGSGLLLGLLTRDLVVTWQGIEHITSVGGAQ